MTMRDTDDIQMVEKWGRIALVIVIVVMSLSAVATPTAAQTGTPTEACATGTPIYDAPTQNDSQNGDSMPASGGAVYAGDDALKAMDSDTGNELWTVSGFNEPVVESPSGDKVYMGTDNNSVKVIDAADGSEIDELLTGSPNDMMFSPTGETIYMALGSEMRAIDADTGQEDWSFGGHTGTVEEVAVSPDGETVFTGSSDDTVKAVDVSTESETWSFGTTTTVRSITVAPDGETVYVGNNDVSGNGRVFAIGTESGSQEWEMNPFDTVDALAAAPDGDHVYAGVHDSTVLELDAETGSTGWTSTEPGGSVFALSIRPDGEMVYSAGLDQTVRALDSANGSQVWANGAFSLSLEDVSSGYPYPAISDGSGVGEQRLVVQTRDLYRPGETHDYRVIEETALANNQTARVDVTDEANVTTTNTTILSVDETDHELSATSDANTSTWVRVDANTSNATGCTNVIVSEPTTENLALLPGIWRANALVSDSTIFALIIAMLLAVPTARFTSAFGGLAVGQMVIVVGWFGGYVTWAIAASSLFVALFIGLNLAANIDYQTGRFRR